MSMFNGLTAKQVRELYERLVYERLVYERRRQAVANESQRLRNELEGLARRTPAQIVAALLAEPAMRERGIRG